MRAIFISYRREDAEGQAGRLFNDLARYFGEDSVFMDVAGIEPGRDFRRVIDERMHDAVGHERHLAGLPRGGQRGRLTREVRAR